MYTHCLLKYIDFYAIYDKVTMDFLYFSSDTSPRDFHITNYLYSGADPGFFFRRGCTRFLLYFNTNKPHSCFFLQNTSCIRKPQVISPGAGGEGGAHPLHPPPRSNTDTLLIFFLVWIKTKLIQLQSAV